MDLGDKLLVALENRREKEARWHAEAILHLNGVSNAQSSKHSMNSLVPLSAVDLPTLLDTLLGIQTLQGVSAGSTWRLKLKSQAKSLRDSKNTDSKSGRKQEQPAAGLPARIKPLPSRRQYWPGEAKDVFWNLVRSLNKYDKKHAPQGKKSPIQLEVAEEITRRWWEDEYGGYQSAVAANDAG